VVSIFEVGQWNGTYYLAMEYIRGRNLAQILRKSMEQQVRIPPEVSIRIIHDAALGLDHAHRASDASGRPLNIVHRDISPQNIMVRDDGLTKVVDFGIARASNRATRTATGAVKGKLAYMAPEQVLSHDVAPTADQFALGIVLWEMLTHRRLFKAERDIDIIRKVMEDPIPHPSTVFPVDAELEGVVMRMLEREAAKRFESCANVAKALEPIAARLTTQLSPADFMRSLGTDDLLVRAKATPTSGSGNFVISLKERPVDSLIPTTQFVGTSEVLTEAQIEATGVSQPAPPAPPTEASSRGRFRVAVGAALVVFVGVAAAFALLRETSRADDARPVVPTAPSVARTSAGLEPAIGSTGLPAPTIAPTPPVPATVLVTTLPPKATLRVDGKPVGMTPQEVELAPGQPHYLLIEKPGYRRVEQDVSVTEGERKELSVKLVPVETGRPSPSSAVNEKAAPGFLSLETDPWTKVSVDGEPLGSTPLFKKRLTAGRHQLVLVNEAANVNEKRFVDIASNETTKLKLTLK
jgi:serine/threonine-protein kinase